MNHYVPLHVHSHFSLLDGLSKPSDIANRCKELGLTACALTDHGNMSGCIQFINAMQKAKLKPIIGCELYISNLENDNVDHLVVLSKNFEGWKDLVKITSFANSKDNIYRGKPRITLEQLKEFNINQNLIAFSGHLGTLISRSIFTDTIAYNAKTYEKALEYKNADLSNLYYNIEKLIDVFGKDNFFLEIQLIDSENLPANIVIAETLRNLPYPKVATPDAHYVSKEYANDHRVLLCIGINQTLHGIQQQLSVGNKVPFEAFFSSNNYHIPSHEEMIAIHTKEELENTIKIADMCETYSLQHNPRLPKFKCPDNLSSDEYLYKLCKEGWEKRKDRINKKDWIKYGERVKEELQLWSKTNLADYFLIVHDIISAAKNRGEFVGIGRGSASGSLVLYLIGVTDIDPIKYDLLLSRFYNEGRNTANNIHLPDIDMDFERSARSANIEYCRNVYGSKNVSQMITFSKLKGRGALKDVLRINAACGFDEINRITKNIPDESKIIDELQEMDEPSIIRWSLENNPKLFDEYVSIDENGILIGKYSKYFEQAIRLEGTNKNKSKHAAGIIISNEALDEICPMVYDNESGEMIASLEMKDLEYAGHIKMDILGVAVLDKLHMIVNQLKYGSMGYENT